MAPVSARLFSAVPMAFEQNQGQLPAGVSFLGRAQNYSVAIEPDRLQFLLPESTPDSTIDVRFAGSRGGAPVSLSGIAYRSNYFIGADRSKWREGVANFSRVGVRGVYPGIDTEFYEKNGELEHDFVIAPGADVDLIRLDLRSKQQAKLTADGDAVIPASTGEIRFRKPVAYQFDTQGRRVAVDAAYRLTGKSLRFELGSYDRRRTLVIDPVIVFATYVSGSAGSTPAQMATDGNGTLFLTGTTTSVSGFPPSAASTDKSGSGSNVFVAAVTTSQLGSALKWITFLGNAGISTATSIAYANATTLYVAGTTTADNFPSIVSGSFGGNFSTVNPSTSGFVSNLNAGTGALTGSTYIASSGTSPTVQDTTTVSALAADSAGNVYIAGYGLGVGLTSVAQLGPASGASSIVPAAAGTTNNAFVIELNSSLKTAALVTYLQSKLPGDYKATAIQIDNSTPINIYVAGTVGGESTVTFPAAQSFTAAGVYDSTKDYTPCSRNAANSSAFVAQIQPPTGASTNAILGFSMLTCADTTSGKETARGLAVGANGFYMVGDTLSPDLAAGIEYSNTGTTKTTASPTAGLQAAFATGNLNGYAIHVPIASGAAGAPSAFTFVGGTSASGDTSVYSIALDATNHLVQLAGQTAATRATMPGAGAPGLPATSQQDQSGNSKRAFLYTFEDTASPAPLSAAALKSISYLGNTTTGSQAVSVQPDTTGAGAFVLVQDTVGTSGFSYSSADAAGAAAPSKSNAYLADIQGTNVAATASGLTLAVDSTNDPIQIDGSSCSSELACAIGYTSSSDTSDIVFTWLLSAPTGQADNVVLNFPEIDALASGGGLAYTIQMDGSASGLTCASKLNNNGTTCTLNDPLPASATPHKITLEGKAGPGANTLAGQVPPTFTFDASAADAQGEFSHAAQNPVTAAKPVTITLALDQDHTTIDASNGTGDTGSASHITQVVYSAKVNNTSSNDSPDTTLKITPPATSAYYFVPGSVSATIDGAAVAGCQADGSGCTQVDVPAGKTLIYSFKVQYLASGLSTTTAGPTSEQISATAKALPLTTNNTAQNASATTQVNGYAALTVSVQAPNYPGAQTAFNLNSGALTYVVTVSNAGPNAGAFSLANTLPTGFAVTSATCAATSATVGTCHTTGGLSFAVSTIASGGSVTYTINGSFPDKGTSADAVPQNAPNANVTDSATITPTGTYSPNALTAQSLTRVVQRSVHLKLSLTTSTTSLTGAAYTAPAYNLGTAISYVYTIQNTGPNIAVNVPLTSAITPPTGYTPPATFVTVTPPTGGSVNCAPNYTACTVSSVPANGTSTLTFTVTYPDTPPPSNVYPAPAAVSAVPTNALTAAYKYGVTTPAVYTNAVDSDTTGTAAGDNTTAYTVNIYRTVHLKLTLANSGPAATGGSYVQPAYNLGSTVSYTYTLQNSGPNIALNVPLVSLLSPPTGYTPPAGSYTISPPTNGSLSCAPDYTACGLESIATGSSTLVFNVVYPDNAPATYVFPTQDLSAVPSNATTAAYNYAINLGATAYSNAVDSNPAGTAGGDNKSTSLANIYRTAALTLTPSVTGPSTPCAPSSPTPCLYMANNGNGTGQNDTATYSVAIHNAGPNLATNSVLTIPLPTNFLVTANPSVAFTGLATSGVPNQLVCSYQVASNSVVCQGYVPTGTSTATITSKFSTSTVPANAAFTTTATPPNTPGSGSVTASAVGGNASTTLPTVNIDRAAHLVAVKLVASAPGNVSPNGFAVGGVLAVNLDEKVAGDANGKNDTVQITQQIGNAGLNDATGVVITDTLPPYFILTKLPDPAVANCTVSGPVTTDAAGHPMTGAAAATLSCTLQNPVPIGTGTAGTGSTHGTVSGAFAQLVYFGKFEDNGLQPDAIPASQGSAAIQFGTLSAASVDLVNLGSASDSTSAPVAPIPVMRAAHLHFTLTQYAQPGDAPLNPVGGVAGPGIAESQLGANGGLVINPVRYQVRVTNDGPNIATSPAVTTTLPPNPNGGTRFVNVAQSIEPSSAQPPSVIAVICAAGQVCQDAGMIPTGAYVLYNVDGNFDINTLVEGNSGSRVFASAITSKGVVDSNPTATAAGDQQTSLPITVVNTPAGANFTLAPFAGNLSQPLSLKLGTVQVAGITGLGLSGSSAPPLPSGPSPYPPDGGATKPLYQFAQGGAYYTLGTTAGVSTASSNPTTICLSSIPGTFQKPERVLMWALSNAPAGTIFGAVPHYTNNGSAGDITLSVTPLGGGNYTVPGPITSYPPPVEPQPAQVCGVLNGLADAANPTTLAVLEPVNFAPYVRSTIAPASTQFGKGVTAGAAIIDLTIAPDKNYDYNDADPCYAGDGGKRTTCNDNVQLTTFLFGGQNLIGDSQQQHSYFYSELQPGTNPPQFNLPAGGPQVYVLLADNLAAQKYPAINNDPLHPLGCDPGTLSATYTPSVPSCTDKPALSTVQTPPQQLPLTDNPSAAVALVGNNALFGGSTGLIAITAPPIPEATAHITAGQTAGFVWNLLTENPLVQGNPLPNFTLTCQSADGKDLASVGIKCSVSPTYVYSTVSNGTTVITAPPTVYVSTSSNTAVGALQEGPLSRDLRIVAAIVFPVGAIPLVLLLRRRRALKLSGWMAVIFLASLVGLGIGCGSNSSFNNQGGTTTTGTTAGSYEFVIVASGTDGSGNPINIKSPAFAVTVSAVH